MTTEKIDELRVKGHRLQPGDRVRLHPQSRGDIFDIALVGQTARVDSVQQDFEGKFHVAVMLDADPGRSVGPRAPAHRFFFSPEELEILAPREDGAPPSSPSILVAGIGNIFLGDDGFGVEVAQRLSRRAWPPGVHVVDFGIRGFDLAYALIAGHDHVILVDACPRGDAPGTVYVIEPDLHAPDGVAPDGHGAALLDAHDMNPMNVIRLAQSMGGVPEHVIIVGCEPETLGPEEGQMSLSPVVERAVEKAATLVESLVNTLVNDAHTGGIQ
jgi:hydrogenase maturation protease